LIPKLLEKGARIRAYDPKASDNFKHECDGIEYCVSARAALKEVAGTVDLKRPLILEKFGERLLFMTIRFVQKKLCISNCYRKETRQR